MRKVNPVYAKITDILVRVLGILGFPGILGGVLFQTMGFKYSSILSCVKALVIGVMIGIIVMFYILRLTKHENVYKRASKEDVTRMIRSFVILTVLMFITLLTANNEQFFLVGIAGATACVVVELIYLISLKVIFKEKKAEED